jgi:hypothetical protein
VTLIAVGACTIQATQAGNANYAAATPVNQSFQVTQAGQTITFGALSNQTFGAAPFTVAATASSGLPVSFASTTPAVCTTSAATVTLIAVGACTIQATQAGNTNYAAATPVNQSFQVTQAIQATPTISGLSPGLAAPGGPAFTLTVNGTGFVSGAMVEWNGAALPTSFVSAAQLTASVPASLIATAGMATVTVMNPGGSPSAGAGFLIQSGPAAVSVTPNSGAGATQTFTGTYMAANGYHDLQWVQMLFAVAPDGGGQTYCFAHYDVQGNAFWLYGDGGFFVGPVMPGTPSNLLQNSLCALNTPASTVSGTGTTLTVNFAVVFKAAAARNIYMRAMNESQADTGWVQRGTWSLGAAALGTLKTGLTPGSSNQGVQQTFTLTYPDPPGFAGAAFGWVQFLVAAATNGGGEPFCFVHYDRAGNGLWMYSSDVGFFVGPATPGTASSTLTSSACSINPAGTTVTNTAGNLVVSVPITLKAPMVGTKNLYQRTLDVLNRDTGWQQTGTWTIQ